VVNGEAVSEPTVANNVVYVVTGDGSLNAFDADGRVGCSGTPKTCNRLLLLGGGEPAGVFGPAAAVVANGQVFRSSADGFTKYELRRP
jgi:hypothetical protein